MSQQFFHTVLHFVAHGVHAYRHHKHAQHEAMKSRAHRLSPLARAAFDASEKLGCRVGTLEADEVALQMKDAPCVFIMEDGQAAGLSACDVQFRRTARDLDDFLSARNKITEYGSWSLYKVNDGFRVGLVVHIKQDAIDGPTFVCVARYLQNEVVAMNAILRRSGFRG